MMKFILVIICLLVILCVIFFVRYYSRFRSISSIKRISDFSDDEYNLYSMDIKYDYDIDRIINYGIVDDRSGIKAILRECLPFIPINIEVPSFGCTAFTLKDNDKKVHMGRNYDFMNNTSSMMVVCNPKNGYKSVSFAALDNIGANCPDGSLRQRFSSLICPFVCLDGINEKGVSIAVLTLDSDPVRQCTGKPVITTTLAIRLVLDRAASTKEAIDLLKKYDMFSSSSRDYHFYITDASGDGRVVEFSPDSKDRDMVVTSSDVVTNFFMIHKSKVKPNTKNGIYGHGRERYDIVLKVFSDEKGKYSNDTVWNALKSSSQDAGTDLTSNTQWSINYNNTDLSLEICIRRRWDYCFKYDMKSNLFYRK